ncbi:MAG: VOC family protein [Caulobacteraceae bacterium]
MSLEAIDHVQLAIPRRGEGAARIFYADFLGLEEQPKPASLAGRGGCWFERDGVKIHCGVEEPFVPANKAHIAFRVSDVSELTRRARDRGFEVVEDGSLPGHERVYICDPFGNRLEFLRPTQESA